MKHSNTLSDRQDDLVAAQSTCFKGETKLRLVNHALKRIEDTLLSCELLDYWTVTDRAKELMREMELNDCIGD
jgi:hypothetical protein